MAKKYIVVVEIEGLGAVPAATELATALSDAQHWLDGNEPHNWVFAADPTVYESLTDLQADVADGHLVLEGDK
jgi:hypothetical protein